MAKDEDRPLSRFRSAIARTVSESWRSTPQFTVTMEVPMDKAEVLRHDLKDAGLAVTLNDVIVKAAALALAKFPLVNGSFAGDSLKLHSDINIGVVVGLPEALLVPVLRACQRLTLKAISQQSRELIERARAGRLSEQELSGGTFTVSNLGMFGVSSFTAIIYPPQAAVLAVGTVAEKVLPREGAPALAKVMVLTLSADHRILDGAYASQFLGEIKEVLEHPARLLV